MRPKSLPAKLRFRYEPTRGDFRATRVEGVRADRVSRRETDEWPRPAQQAGRPDHHPPARAGSLSLSASRATGPRGIAGEGISEVILSVSTENNESPSLTISPYLTKISPTTPSCRPSPISANLNLNIFLHFFRMFLNIFKLCNFKVAKFKK